MKVITTNREIIYSNACGCGESSSNASGEDKRALFQKWANTNKGLKLRTDGVKDAATTDAYKKFGKDYESLQAVTSVVADAAKAATDETKKGALDTVADLFKKDDTNPPVSSTKAPEDAKAAKKKKMIKIALIGGGLIALGAIIIAISKRKK